MSQELIAAGLHCRALWPYVGMIEALREDAARAEALDIDPENGTALQAVRQRRGYAKHFCRSFCPGRLAQRGAPIEYRVSPYAAQSHCRPMGLLIEHSFPFIKRELLSKNPSRVPDVAAWSSV
jgi:hypothetical protein